MWFVFFLLIHVCFLFSVSFCLGCANTNTLTPLITRLLLAS